MRLGLLVLLTLLFPSASHASTPVRVLLDVVVAETHVVIDGAHRVRTERSDVQAATGFDWPVRAMAGELYSAGLPVGAWLELTPTSGAVTYGPRLYRGTLRLEASGDAIRIVNVLDLEAYLRGVVPSEMQASWPLEALKAQAIAARTFTLYNLDADAPYDICATTDCQVYRGMEGEHPNSDRAIAETEGKILTWNGGVVRAHYHADSGGTTASSAEVFGFDLPYLTPRADEGVTSPHRNWRAELRPSSLAAALAHEGRPVGTPTHITIHAWSASGRAERATIHGSSRDVTLAGPSLTRVLRGAGLKSTVIRMTGALSVQGTGWGHGVGMSQWGARSLADAGLDAEAILAHYYPGVAIDLPLQQAAR